MKSWNTFFDRLFSRPFALKRAIQSDTASWILHGKATFRRIEETTGSSTLCPEPECSYSLWHYTERADYEKTTQSTLRQAYQERFFVLQESLLEPAYCLLIYTKEQRALHRCVIAHQQPPQDWPYPLQDTHCCALDTYALTWILQSPEHFSTDYRIQGPRKDTRIITHFSPS